MKYIFLILTLLLLYSCDQQNSGKKISEFEQINLDLVERWFPERSGEFIFREIKNHSGDDYFEVATEGDKILISGTNGVSTASGFYWYIKNYCNVQVSINANTTPLPEKLPKLLTSVRKTTPFNYRNFFNYCTFGYTTPWWGWDQWELLIDWMAMNGINMPLATTGQEAVWQELLDEEGLSDKEIEAFLVGPAFLPWGWMGNIDGMAGPIPQNWIDTHKELQQQILERERSFGMTPILQGFTGHIPKALIDNNPDLKYVQTTDWAGMPGTYFLDPKDPLFSKLGKRFIEIQTDLFGTDHLYDADCFNEVNPPTNDTGFISEVSKTVFASMQAADPEAKWVMQGWFLFWQKNFWKEPQARALLDPIPQDKLLLLDLYGEKNTVWDKTKAFYGKPWIWNIICNNGQKVNLSGDLQIMNDNLQDAMHNPEAGQLSGIGVMMEGFGYNPVVQDLIGHFVWEPDSMDVSQWLNGYAQRRYGKPSAHAENAWQGLMKSVYSRTILGESAICYPPGRVKPQVTETNPYGVDYPTEGLFEAARELLAASDDFQSLPAYEFDLVHVFREVLSIKANVLLDNAFRALEVQDASMLKAAENDFMGLLDDMDQLLGSNELFLLGKWINDARSWGKTPEESDYYEMNAKSIVTLWQPSTDTQLRDYASKQWNGMVGDFYAHRWKRFFAEGAKAINARTELDYGRLQQELLNWELNWVESPSDYSSKPQGDPVTICKKLLGKYLGE